MSKSSKDANPFAEVSSVLPIMIYSLVKAASSQTSFSSVAIEQKAN
jgi:hypothetical protein